MVFVLLERNPLRVPVVHTESFLKALFDMRLLEILLPGLKHIIQPGTGGLLSRKTWKWFFVFLNTFKEMIGSSGTRKAIVLNVIILRDLG
jgi:hypothetical protein